jgi:tetratricopeptide (TPR) repeat protein
LAGGDTMRRVVQILILSIIPALAGVGQQINEYQLSGVILQEDGKPFRDVVPRIFLYGSKTPFSKSSLADRSGKFRVKNLAPGMYTVQIYIPRAGEMTQTIEVGPSFADGKRNVRGTFTFRRRSSEEAHQEISAVELSVPESAHREYRRAQEELGRRNVTKAIEFLQKAVKIAPQFAAGWNNLGTIAYQNGRFEQAEHYFREALRQDAEAYPPLVNLGGALISSGKISEALDVNLAAVKASPGDALAHAQLGQNYFFLDRLTEAEQQLREAKALDSGHFSFPQLFLARIYAKQKNAPLMKAELEEFLRLHPDAPQAAELRTLIDSMGQ